MSWLFALSAIMALSPSSGTASIALRNSSRSNERSSISAVVLWACKLTSIASTSQKATTLALEQLAPWQENDVGSQWAFPSSLGVLIWGKRLYVVVASATWMEITQLIQLWLSSGVPPHRFLLLGFLYLPQIAEGITKHNSKTSIYIIIIWKFNLRVRIRKTDISLINKLVPSNRRTPPDPIPTSPFNHTG